MRRLQRDLRDLLAFFRFLSHLWRELRTTNLIERCFVEARRGTWPMVCIVNPGRVDRIVFTIFNPY